jgi:hypothetical protein
LCQAWRAFDWTYNGKKHTHPTCGKSVEFERESLALSLFRLYGQSM